MSSNLLPIIRDLHSFFFSADRGHAENDDAEWEHCVEG